MTEITHDDQNENASPPWNRLTSRGDHPMEKLIQFQMPNDLERQPQTVELTATHHMKAGRVDLHPLRSNWRLIVSRLLK